MTEGRGTHMVTVHSSVQVFADKFSCSGSFGAVGAVSIQNRE